MTSIEYGALASACMLLCSELLLRISRRLLASASLSAPIYVHYLSVHRQIAKEEKSEINPPNAVDSSRSRSSWLTEKAMQEREEMKKNSPNS